MLEKKIYYIWHKLSSGKLEKEEKIRYKTSRRKEINLEQKLMELKSGNDRENP